MGRQNIFTTLGVASVLPQSMRTDLLEFLVNNRQYILTPAKKSEAFKTRFSGHTPISEIVHRIMSLGKDQTYSLIRLPSKTTALREVVDMTFVPFDILQLKEVTPSFSKTLSLLPEINDKIIVNITDITKANGEFSDITQFHWRIVRDFLSRSFFVSSGNVWISPSLVRYVAKVYSMTIGGQIARLFGLSPLIQMFIQTVFGLYFVGKMTTSEIAPEFMKSHYKGLGLYDPQDLGQILAFVEDTLEKKTPESLEDVFAVIDAYDHDQLKTTQGSRLTRAVLNVKLAQIFPENHVSTIALEYPPYFLFLILLVLSNVRIGLSFPMKNLNLDREGKDLMEQLLKSPLFTSGI